MLSDQECNLRFVSLSREKNHTQFVNRYSQWLQLMWYSRQEDKNRNILDHFIVCLCLSPMQVMTSVSVLHWLYSGFLWVQLTHLSNTMSLVDTRQVKSEIIKGNKGFDFMQLSLGLTIKNSQSTSYFEQFVYNESEISH